MKFGVISPQDWGLPVLDADSDESIPGLDITVRQLNNRIRGCTYDWAQNHYDQASGAFFGFYSPVEKRFEPPQTVNLIAPWQFLATFDHFGDRQLLGQAERASEWFYQHFVVTHPMSIVIGGVRESLPERELWTKFSAEFVVLNCGLYSRTDNRKYLERALQSAMFLIQSTRHGFAPKYSTQLGEWQEKGWQSFGRVVEAMLILADVTGENQWTDLALRWGAYGISLLADDGGLYLIDDDYFNTDIAADELRAFVFLHELTGREDFLAAGEAFARWLIVHQQADGAWPLTIDRDGNIVVPTVGPGDIPNIAIALLRLYGVSHQEIYLEAAQRALRYSLSVQVLPESDHPYSDDPNVRWGFWSWMPHYDYTVSGDQATHHIRGFLFALDYLPGKQARSV